MDQVPKLPDLFFRQWSISFAVPFLFVLLCWRLFPGWWLLSLLCAVPAGIFLWCHRRDRHRRRAGFLLLMGIIAALLFVSLCLVAEDHRRSLDGAEVRAHGVILQRTEEGRRVLLFREGSLFPSTVLLEDETFFPGDRIRCEVILSADVTQAERETGFAFRAEPTKPVVRTGRFRILSRLDQAREKCLSFWSEEKDVGAFYQAILFGDRSSLSGSLRQAFLASGVLHLIAVSGLHVSLILGALHFFLLLLTRNIRLTRFVELLALGPVIFLTGAGISVWRAALMTGLTLVFSLRHRRPASMTFLFAVALFLALCNPYSVGSASYLLTFSATFAILAVAAPLSRFLARRWEGGKSPLLRRAALSIAASLFISLSCFAMTLPCQVLLYGSVQPFAVLYNFFLIPLFTPCIVLGLVSLPAAFLPALRFLKLPALWYGKFYLALVRFVGSGALGTSVALGNTAWLCALLAVFLIVLAFSLRLRCDRFLLLSLFLMGAVFLFSALA